MKKKFMLVSHFKVHAAQNSLLNDIFFNGIKLHFKPKKHNFLCFFPMLLCFSIRFAREVCFKNLTVAQSIFISFQTTPKSSDHLMCSDFLVQHPSFPFLSFPKVNGKKRFSNTPTSFPSHHLALIKLFGSDQFKIFIKIVLITCLFYQLYGSLAFIIIILIILILEHSISFLRHLTIFISIKSGLSFEI
ncbi:hypothetical protein BpHYR1_039643 [Brachionus plicatilis]|uniref:Transmembrane protein n=1 Tax=Brachionus plicatilis TaxID=10195 RepID=A0A3M7S7M2_BRAPC|nr:hypothetical protein BpHYR1_039643 [Brachionus plicatilis]